MLRSYNTSSGTGSTMLDRQLVTSFNNALHRPDSQNSMVDNAQYLHSDTIQAMRASDIGGFPHYEQDGPRVLPTSTDHLSPSPQSTSRDQVHIREKHEPRPNSEAVDALTSPTPIQEQLYQQALNSSAQEEKRNDHQYDLIKTNATLKDSPSRRPGSQSFQRGSTSPQQRSLSQQLPTPEPSLIEPYAEIMHHQMTSASNLQPSPYEQSMASLPARRTPPRPPRGSLEGSNEAAMSFSQSQLPSVNEGLTTPQPWYSAGDSDAGSIAYPSSEIPISPYMSTASSQIVSPYSQPQPWTSNSQSSLPPDGDTILRVEV